jgi:hypothetical protein
MTDTETKSNQDDLAKAMLAGLEQLIKTATIETQIAMKNNNKDEFTDGQREELSDMIYERVQEHIETQLDDIVNDKINEWLDNNLAERMNDRISIHFD